MKEEIIPAAVTQTASDALRAKQSAAAAHYSWDPLYDSLLEKVSRNSHRRQTPLVNAAYAVRVSCVLETIRRFLRFHEGRKLQIVFLGAGLDVTGLWATEVATKRTDVVVVEVDTPEICNEKAHLLADISDSDFDVEELQNCRVRRCRERALYLVARDLRMESSFEAVTKIIEGDRITLFVSELVLTYLPESRAAILKKCARLPQTSIVLFEPIGPPPASSSPTTLGAFQKAYYSRFQEKVNFRPLGSRSEDVSSSLKAAGFDWNCTVTALEALQNLRPTFEILEPFDEHAALLFHLQSYAVSMAGPIHQACHEGRSTRFFRQNLTCRFQPKRISDTSNLWLTELDLDDELPLRDLFEESYLELCKVHVPIRKMVKAALSGDLKPSPTENCVSSIRNRYVAKKGDFFSVVTSEGLLVGAIGVRPCSRMEVASRVLPPNCAEIHRLVVHPLYRRQGIASALLHAVFSPALSLVATTATLSEGVSAFYSANGFSVYEDVSMGDLVLTTFIREEKAERLHKIDLSAI